jgi:hypothetical protein
MTAKSRGEIQDPDRGDDGQLTRPAKRFKFAASSSESGEQDGQPDNNLVADAVPVSEDDPQDQGEPLKASDLYLDTVSEFFAASIRLASQLPA